MKILHVHDIGYSLGGAEVIVSSLVEAQRRCGHDVRVLTSFDSRNTFATDTYTTNEKTMWDKFIRYTWNKEARRVARKLFETFQPDIVHIHSITKTSPSIFSVFGTTPIVMTIHNFGIIDPTRIDLPSLATYGNHLGDYFVFNQRSLRWFVERFRHEHIIKRSLRRVSLFLPSSQFMQSVIYEYEPRWRSRVVPLGIPLYPRHQLPSSVVFLGIGRFVQEKGFDHLIEAFSRVIYEIPQARLLL
ncbi:MAG: glycosyltransferase family 4 protein, partial [Patescibacteria group bacterium]|nr:glycosyltransferase family 4 protein [Patescibacteria group bacterium]